MDVENEFNCQQPNEFLARHISLSLRSIDISVEQIAEHYHEMLVSHMFSGHVNGEKSTNTLASTLFAHVHSFFLHLGAVRDYASALIAFRLGLNHNKVDSMARLVDEVRPAHFLEDNLLELIISEGNISVDPLKSNRFIVDGWIREATLLRNELIHRRPYGSKYKELFGWIEKTGDLESLYRYFRPLKLNDREDNYLFDVIVYHYRKCVGLMKKLALASGEDTAMMRFADIGITPPSLR